MLENFLKFYKEINYFIYFFFLSESISPLEKTRIPKKMPTESYYLFTKKFSDNFVLASDFFNQNSSFIHS